LNSNLRLIVSDWLTEIATVADRQHACVRHRHDELASRTENPSRAIAKPANEVRLAH
jgi:hypothetical protein